MKNRIKFMSLLIVYGLSGCTPGGFYSSMSGSVRGEETQIRMKWYRDINRAQDYMETTLDGEVLTASILSYKSNPDQKSNQFEAKFWGSGGGFPVNMTCQINVPERNGICRHVNGKVIDLTW